MTQPGTGAPGLWTTPVRGRAALSALAWVVVYMTGLVVVVVLGLLGARAAGTGRPDTALLALVVLAGTAVAALVAVRVHLLRRRGLGWADVGLRRPARSPLHLLWQIPAVMLAGAVASMVVLLPLGVGPEADAGDEAIAELALGGPLIAVLGLLAVAVIVPVAEEVIFRGIVLPALRARLTAVPGIAVAGAVFAAVHLLPPALPYLLVVGISLGIMAQWYRSIVPGIVLHGVNNAVVFGAVVAAGAA
ncbi:CPBP family intramembrane glutamic endopeptidase [Rhodococcus sp. IEGM 1408]|uniref:CPBP family intramembrane glutamic endopeptidase n=1 Tax=Rhodococcus sp. IEGM 1408 TaxID=3082220 RepID=UPI00295571C5|nr:CPBP family intramembrane glutamic endopeptidase [Rhodococcus sp. IEGM 1408]MDV8001133.1 CPBP family intramembrane glutamic endopeptidase [Rhodococcus sp. IEGM 1408]